VHPTLQAGGRVLWFAVVLVLACTTAIHAGSAPVHTRFEWDTRAGNITFDAGGRRLRVRFADTRFELLYGAGPVARAGSRIVLPPKQNVRLFEARRLPDGRVWCRYAAGASGREIFDLTIGVSSDGPRVCEVRLRWSSPTATWDGVWPGFVLGLDQHRGAWLTRYAEAYGHQSGPVTWYCPASEGRGLWLCGRWDVRASNMSGFRGVERPGRQQVNPNFPVVAEARKPRSGTGPFPVVPATVYEPDTTGARLPLDDTLVLRLGSDLWQVVPDPAITPSPYRRELARSVFVDCWHTWKARELAHQFELMGRVARGRIRLFGILQNWQAGGFDALLPDSVRMPDFPPNPTVGTVEELRRLCQTARRFGRFGFRTNYVLPKPHAPSVKKGEAHRARTPSGKERTFIRPKDLIRLAYRQEPEISRLFGPDCTFSDQLGSAGMAGAYIDFDALNGTRSLRETWACLEALCTYLRAVHGGPLASETLNSEYLIGVGLDTGDYGMFAGHDRSVAPDYKLRKLHPYAVFHGMGLGYRFYFAPPYGGTDKIPRGERLYIESGPARDDYRAMEILFGNGGYLYFVPDIRWDFVLSEIVMVGALQRHYALEPVADIRYRRPGTQEWIALEDFIRAGGNATPVRWIPQPRDLRCVRIRYRNGLQIIVNRDADPVRVTCNGRDLTIPRYGWVAWFDDGRLTAFSAFWPGSRQRVDFLEDREWQWRFLDPRGGNIENVEHPTLFENGRPVVELIRHGEVVRVDGEEFPTHLPSPPPARKIDFRFDKSLCGWICARDLAPFEIRDGALFMITRGRDPFLVSPKLEVAGDRVREIVIEMSAGEDGTGQFFWSTTTEPMTEKTSVRFHVKGDGDFHVYRLPVGEHPLWKEHTITRIRIDPISHDAETIVRIRCVRGVQTPAL